MGLQVIPATDEHDQAVTALFSELQVAIEPAYWERAFSPENPAGASRPFVCVDDDENLHAFAAARPIELHIEGEFVESQAVHDFVVSPGMLMHEAATALVREIERLMPLTIFAGAGVEALPMLERMNYQKAGFYTRARYAPGQGKRSPSPVLPFQLELLEKFPEDLGPLNTDTAGAGHVFRRRTGDGLNWMFKGPANVFEVFGVSEHTPLDAYIVLRHVPGREEMELHVADAFCRPPDISRLAAALAAVAEDRMMPLYVSLFGEAWARPLTDAGFESLRPRWPLHWILRDPRHRGMGIRLMQREAWLFTPADGEIDHW